MKVKLTKKFIDSVDYTAKGTEIYMDDVLTGFALRVANNPNVIHYISVLTESYIEMKWKKRT